MQIVIKNYGVNGIVVPSLKTQLFFFAEIAKFYELVSRMQLLEIVALFQKLDSIKRILVTEVMKLVKLILVMPATNVVSKRSFSSRLCSETANNRLNHLLLLHIHKLLTDNSILQKLLMSSLKEENEENQNLDFDIVRP